MHLWIQYMMAEVCSAGFPHSEIAGSQDICSSPALIAAYHVFHRLSVPRHPPCALCSMTTSLYSVTTMGRSFSLRKKCVCKKLILYGLMSYHFQYVVFKVRLSRFKKLNLNCIMRIELMLSIPIRIIQYFLYKSWHPPTLPCRLQQSTIGRLCLNHRVRNGNGCAPQAHRHQLCFKLSLSAHALRIGN